MNLSTAPNFLEGDIALHANPRFTEGNVVVRNSYERGEWMAEERSGPPLTLQKNAHFKCTITGFSDKFQVYIAHIPRIAVTPWQQITHRHHPVFNLDVSGGG